MGGLFSGARAWAAAGAGVVAAGLMAAGLVAVQAEASPPVTVTGIQAPLPANAAAIPEASLPWVSCASAGSCTAVGSYTDSSGHGQGLLVTEASGSWTAAEAPLPANAVTNPGASLSSVSCVSAGGCTAAGTYAASPGEQGLLVTEASGSWTAAEAPLPANANSAPGADLSSVSCALAGNCTAVGTYFDSSVHHQGLLVTETSGSWTAAEAPLPANAAASYQGADLFSVSCASAGNCSAVGSYTDTSGYQQGLLLTETSGSWTAAEAALPADATAGNPDVGLYPVSCASAGNCTAVGYYTDSSGYQQGLLLTETSGSWAAGVEAPLPVNASSDPDASPSSVSCASAGNCTAVGQYTDSSGYQQGLLLNETSGSWTAAEAALPANAATSYPDVYLSSVSCASVGNCTAAGYYVDSSRSNQGLLLTETSGSWAAGADAPLPANANSNSVAVLTSVSCASAGSCTATGNYIDTSGNDQDLLVTQSTPQSAATQTVASCSPDPVLTGSAATCTATVTDTSSSPSPPSGQVNFSSATGTFPVGGSCTLAPVAGSTSQASCQVSYTQDQAGAAAITAAYTGGDGVHQASSGSPVLTVLDPTQATVSCAPDPVLAGTTSGCTATVTDTATANPSPPGGQVTFTSTGSGSFPDGSSCTLAAVAGSSSQASCQVSYTQAGTGQPQISISYAGDGTHAGVPAAGSPAVSAVLSVVQNSTSTQVSCGSAPVTVGQGVTCTATVTDQGDQAAAVTPTGPVTFTATGPGSFTGNGQCTLSGSTSTASCPVTYTPTAVGTPQITATYGGDGQHLGSSGYTTVTGLDATAIAVGCSPGTVLALTATRCTATVTDLNSASPVTPGGTITFTTTGSGTFTGNGQCTLSGSGSTASCQVSFTPAQAGTAQVSASYAGDPSHTASGATTTLTVFLDPAQASISCSPDPVPAGTTAKCTATVTDTSSAPVTPGGTVTFTSTGSGTFTGNGQCTLSGTSGTASCQVSYTQAGNGLPQLTASYGGDSQHQAASPATLTLPVYQPLTGNSTCAGVDGGTPQNLTVPAGDTCTLVAGTVVSGNITDDGTLTITSATVKGNLQTQNAGPLTLTGAGLVIGGNLQVQGGAPVTITGSPAGGSGYGIAIGGNLQVQQLASGTTASLVCATQVNGNVQWQNNAAPVTIGGPSCSGNSIGGNLQVQNNTMPASYTSPAATIEHNTIKGNLQSQNNTPAAVVSGNTVGGNTQTS